MAEKISQAQTGKPVLARDFNAMRKAVDESFLEPSIREAHRPSMRRFQVSAEQSDHIDCHINGQPTITQVAKDYSMRGSITGLIDPNDEILAVRNILGGTGVGAVEWQDLNISGHNVPAASSGLPNETGPATYGIIVEPQEILSAAQDDDFPINYNNGLLGREFALMDQADKDFLGARGWISQGEIGAQSPPYDTHPVNWAEFVGDEFTPIPWFRIDRVNYEIKSGPFGPFTEFTLETLWEPTLPPLLQSGLKIQSQFGSSFPQASLSIITEGWFRFAFDFTIPEPLLNDLFGNAENLSMIPDVSTRAVDYEMTANVKGFTNITTGPFGVPVYPSAMTSIYLGNFPSAGTWRPEELTNAKKWQFSSLLQAPPMGEPSEPLDQFGKRQFVRIDPI